MRGKWYLGQCFPEHGSSQWGSTMYSPVTPVLCFKFKLDSVRPSVQRPHSPCMHSDVPPPSASVLTWRNEALCSACGICAESDDSQSSCKPRKSSQLCVLRVTSSMEIIG